MHTFTDTYMKTHAYAGGRAHTERERERERDKNA